MIKKLTWNLTEASKRIMGNKWCEGKREQVMKQNKAVEYFGGKEPSGQIAYAVFGGPRQDYVYSAYDFIGANGDIFVGVVR